MKKMLIFFLVVSFISLGIFPLLSQEEKNKSRVEISSTGGEKPYPSYNPRGRRDPFRDLLAGREVKEKALVGGVPQLSINDVNLIGIVKAKGKYTAIINGPQGFPFFIKKGDRFSDGFVLSIKESQVVLRKTKERGIPLMKPKDIVKEINPEER
jgi:Tfp pilus assembly protein PilP